MSDLKVQKDEYGFEYVLLDPLTAHFFQPARAVLFGLVSKCPDALPQEGYIIPFPAAFSPIPEIINELEIRATEGLNLNHEAVPTPSLSRVTSAIQIKINGKVKDGDFEKGGKVSIVSGVLKTETIQDWRNWRLVDERWVHDLWDWTQFDPERLDDNKYKLLASRSGSAFIQKEQFIVIKEREEKILLLATICLLFNHWKRKRKDFSGDRQALHLGHLSFGMKATRVSVSNWIKEAGCGVKSKSVILDELEALQNQTCRHFEQNPEEFSDFMINGAGQHLKIPGTVLKLLLPSKLDLEAIATHKAAMMAEYSEVDAYMRENAKDDKTRR